MATVNPSPFSPIPQWVDSSGAPAVGYKVFHYVAGSTSTKVDTYTDSTGSVANANPIILNALGEPSTQIWLTQGQSYKMVLAPSTDTDPPTTPIFTVDNLYGINDPINAPANSEWVTFAGAPTFVNATSFTLAGNQTSIFQVGRRVRTTNTAGTIYSTITASVFTTLTTLTVVNDSGVLDSGLSAASYGLLSAINPSLPNSSAVRSTMGIGDPLSINGFRLTLTSALPVTTADVVGASTIYACPYKGSQIALWTTPGWSVYASAQFSIALSGLTSGRPYDVFCFLSAGVPTLELLAWTSDTARATALAYQDGVLVKSGDATRRYMGTFYTTAATTTEDSEGSRYLWNYYHRVARALKKSGANASWTYAIAVWRQAQGSVANQVNWVHGVSEDDIQLQVLTAANGSTGAFVNFKVGIGVDSTTAPSFDASLASTINTGWFQAKSGSDIAVAAGRHFAAWLEIADSAVSVTFTGAGAGSITGRVFA